MENRILSNRTAKRNYFPARSIGFDNLQVLITWCNVQPGVMQSRFTKGRKTFILAPNPPPTLKYDCPLVSFQHHWTWVLSICQSPMPLDQITALKSTMYSTTGPEHYDYSLDVESQCHIFRLKRCTVCFYLVNLMYWNKTNISSLFSRKKTQHLSLARVV